jgi:hypothetical protein
VKTHVFIYFFLKKKNYYYIIYFIIMNHIHKRNARASSDVLLVYIWNVINFNYIGVLLDGINVIF